MLNDEVKTGLRVVTSMVDVGAIVVEKDNNYEELYWLKFDENIEGRINSVNISCNGLYRFHCSRFEPDNKYSIWNNSREQSFNFNNGLIEWIENHE